MDCQPLAALRATPAVDERRARAGECRCGNCLRRAGRGRSGAARNAAAAVDICQLVDQ